MPSNEVQTDTPVDLTNCDQEPIHIPSRIQPHGVLLTIREPEWTILQVSANTLPLFGKSPEELHGKPLETLFDAGQIATVRERCQRENLDGNPLYIATLTPHGQEQRFDGTIHRIDGVLALELEPAAVASIDDLNYYTLVKKVMPTLQAARTVTELCQVVTQQVRQMCRYDRVMVYKFHEDGHGSVIAEDRRDDLETWLNLNYPEADIPKQARRLLELTPLRLIADVNYTPADLLPNRNPLTGEPLDMTNCLLRSVSPMHIEYLQNMGVGATLGISLLQNGKLWGMIIGHHFSPRYLSYEVRTVCELLGQAVSMQISSKAENEDQEHRLHMQSVQTQLLAMMTQEGAYLNGLYRHTPNLLDFMEAGGAAICMNGECIRLGETPDDVFLTHLADWLSTNSDMEVLAIDHLSGVIPEALPYREIASGLLAITISREQKHYLLWFRPEVVQSVLWGGNPNKSVEVGNDGTARIKPRKSFTVWQEVIQNKSLPWKQMEIGAARNLRYALIGVVLTETNAQQEQQFALIKEQATQLASQKVNLEAMNVRLIEMAATDGLTGLQNHRTFQERLAEECLRATRYKPPLSLLLLDVDHFKQFNDAFGHPAGDAILKQVASILHECARKTDVVARYGGEEFVIILTETDADQAMQAAERVRSAIKRAEWAHRAITVSIGISTLQEGIELPAAMVQAADKALYFSKRTGRNRSAHWNELPVEAEEDLRGDLTQPYTSIIAEIMQMQADTLCSASEQIHSMMADTYDATIVSWSRLLDLKDKETECHAERVTDMMLRMANQVGMNAEELLYARWGALLHDVGKMGVPDDILHKPGPLTAEEWVVMKSHTTIAYELLTPVSFLRPALDIPYYHHEKWDGTGYPRGLFGDDIPLSARLFAIADVYDALTNDRPYRAAWSHEKTVAHIVSLAGTHFDPRAVKVFLSVIQVEESISKIAA
jgi:diguanylate cyclase (GGDEF)-like protein/putative nucleotidyltransferase with HDIG domain